MNGKRNYTFRANQSLLAMAPGASIQMGLTVRGIDSRGAVDWVLLYRNGASATDLQTDAVNVSRSNDGNSWTIEPAGETIPAANAALYDADGNGNASGEAAYFAVPFKLTLTKK